VSTPEVFVHATGDLLASAAAARTITRLADAIAAEGRAHLVLTGGGIGTKVIAAIGASPARDAVDWNRVNFWWGDERFAPAGDPETGRLEGITAAHNAVRAMVSTQPPLPDLTWSPTLAAYAQAWATQLASSPSTCAAPVHRSSSDLQAKDYGENLAAFSGSGRGVSGDVSTAQQAVNGWASEVSCWTYGTILGTEQCNMTCSSNLHSDGCGHYTQIVWRKSLLLGCGVATCMNGQATEDIWICNYSPAGNVVGQAPY